MVVMGFLQLWVGSSVSEWVVSNQVVMIAVMDMVETALYQASLIHGMDTATTYWDGNLGCAWTD